MHTPATPLRILAAASFAAVACKSGTPPVPQYPVQLTMDQLGITHVLAQTDADAFYGGGYAMARDRLFQMEMTRREADGTQAEVLGGDALGSDEETRLFNFAALGASDYALLQKTDPTSAHLLDAWVDGINERIAEITSGAAPLPTGFGSDALDFMPGPWTSADCLAVGKLLAWGLSGTLDQDLLVTVLQRLEPTTFQHLPIVTPGFDSYIVPSAEMSSSNDLRAHSRSAAERPEGFPPVVPSAAQPALVPLDWHEPMQPRRYASNNWAVAGKFTSNGHPMLAGDPHQSLDSPNPLWPVHLSSIAGGGSLDVIGFVFPGTTGIQLGMNGHVAWTATVAAADVTDLWDTPVDSDFTTASVGGKSVPIVNRVETFNVRGTGMPAGQGTTQQFTYQEVPGYGVFVPGEILPVPLAFVVDNQLLMNWVGFSATTEASGYIQMDKATDITSWHQAASHLQVGAVNFIAADQNDILAYTPANVPDRGVPSSRPMPWHVVDGTDPANFWTRGFLPASELVDVLNPTRGYLVSANNDPFGFTADGSVEDDPWYYGAIYVKGQRSYRIEQVLSGWLAQQHAISPSDMQSLQADVHSVTADMVLPLLATAVAAIPTDATLTQWQNQPALVALAGTLAAWDRDYSQDEGQAAVFQGFMWFATSRMLESQISAELFSIIPGEDNMILQTFTQDLLTGRIPDDGYFMPQGKNAILIGAIADTDAWLHTRFGTDDPTQFKWSDFHGDDWSALISPQFNVPRAKVSGGPDTVNVSGAPFFGSDGGPVQNDSCTEASAYRMVMDFDGGRPEATVDITLGVSGDPTSPHWMDLQPDWLAVNHVPLPFTTEEIAASDAGTVTLPAAR